jgi:hypothetical protein
MEVKMNKRNNYYGKTQLKKYIQGDSEISLEEKFGNW